MKRYLCKVCGNVLIVTFISMILPLLLYKQMSDGIVREHQAKDLLASFIEKPCI
jgi:hypothetical protein